MSLFNTHPLYLSLLSEYAAGALEREHRMMVAAHLSLSAQARAFIRRCEALSAAMIERECEPVSMRETALDSVLGKIDARMQARAERAAPRHPWPEDLPLPEVIQHYLLEQMREQQRADWQHEADGVDIFDVPTTCEQKRLRMTRLAPGYVREPQIRETHTEITLVLGGGMTEEQGSHAPGTLIIKEHTTINTVKACDQQGCVYIRLSEIE